MDGDDDDDDDDGGWRGAGVFCHATISRFFAATLVHPSRWMRVWRCATRIR